MSKVENFLTPEGEASIINAIRIAEGKTSGEIRVHLEATSNIDAFERAAEVFDFLHMNNTKYSNGVLIYVAIDDRTLVILGDKGINDKVNPHFWESTKDIIIAHFKKGDIAPGLVDGIMKAGEQLKNYFPFNTGDKNELPDAISIG